MKSKRILNFEFPEGYLEPEKTSTFEPLTNFERIASSYIIDKVLDAPLFPN